MKNRPGRLEKAAEEVWSKYLAYGLVDDGTEQGEAFDAALDELMRALVEQRGIRQLRKPRRCN